MMKKSGASFLFLFLFLVFACLPASAAGAQKPLVFPSLSSMRLLNNLQVFMASTPYLGDGMTIGLVIRYGSAFDKAGKAGTAYLTSRMIGKATLDRNSKEIQDELNYLHATLEVQCDWDGIRFLLRGQSDTYERSLLLLYQIVCEAQFNEEDLSAVRGELMRQLQAPPDPRQGVRGQFEEELFRGTTYGRPLRGTASTIQNIAIGDIRYFYHLFFSPDQAALVVTGSAPAETVLQKSRRIWGVWVRGEETPFTFLPPREPGGRNIFLEDDPGSPAAQFILGNLWPGREDPAFYAGMLAVQLVQDRLTEALPSSLLTVAAEGRRMSGPFYIQGQAAADQAVGEINKILDVVDSFKQSAVGVADATRVQDQWIAEFGKLIASTDGICNVLLDSELYRLGVNYVATFPDFVKRSSPAMIQEAAKRWLFPGGLIIIVRGPAELLRSQLETLGTVQPLKR